MDKKKIKKYSVQLNKLLEHLKINNPTPLQERMFKELNQEERGIYMVARKKKVKADRKKTIQAYEKEHICQIKRNIKWIIVKRRKM